MKTRDILVEAGFLSAKAGSKILEERGLTEEARLLSHRLDEIVLQLLEIARKIDS